MYTLPQRDRQVHHSWFCKFLIKSAFCAAIILGRLSSSFAHQFLILKSFSYSKLSETSKGTKCCIGLFIIKVFFVFSWNTTNSAPRTFPSLLSKNLFIYPLRHKSLGLLSLIITISPIRNFARLFEFLFVFNECRSNNADNIYSL